MAPEAEAPLEVVRREVEVMADPENVPEAFEVDLGEAGIGDGLRWSAVKDQFGAKPVIVGRDFMIASIAAPTVVEEAPAAAPGPVEATKQKAPAAAAAAPAKKKK